MSIEKYISPFIQTQFPEFYKEYGTNFIAFIRAYYEWMETAGNPVNQARSLYEYADIDTTLDDFVRYFKNKYMLSIPQSTMVDQRLLTKHILDLYKSKGSKRAYELLFRILFNEDIQVYVPGNDLFRLSSNEFVKPKYIEVSDSQYLIDLIGRTITSSSGTGTAVVDNYYTKIVNNEILNVFVLSDLSGTFNYGDRIMCDDLLVNSDGDTIGRYEYNNLSDTEQAAYSLAITIADAPFVLGSLSAIGITNGGAGFQVGDILRVDSDGDAGLARVSAVRNENGKVTFTLIDGGSGFSMHPTIRVAGGGVTSNLVISSPIWTSTYMLFNIGSNTTTIYSSNGTAANSVTNTYVNSLLANLTIGDTLRVGNDSIGTQYLTIMSIGNTTTNSTVSVANISLQDPYSLLINFDTSVNGNNIIRVKGGGEGATFRVGDLTDREVYTLNRDKINSFAPGPTAEDGVQIDDITVGCNVYYTGLSGQVFELQEGGLVYSNTTGHITRPIDVSYVFNNNLANGENLSNTSLGINTLKAYRVDGSLLYVYGADVENANLTSNTRLISNTTSSIVSIINVLPVQNTYGNGTIIAANSTCIQVNGNNFGYFIPGTNIYTVNGTIATVTSMTRNTDWTEFGTPTLSNKNLDQTIANALDIYDLEVGTITYLTAINPGEGYASDPTVSIMQQDIYDLKIADKSGYKGFNAIVTAKAGAAGGVVTAVDVYDSGFGYSPRSSANLVSSNTENQTVVSGRLVVDTQGVGSGDFTSRSGFLSDTQHVIDSKYWQMQSYDIIAPRMMYTYEKFVRDLVHPSGIALFGSFWFKSEVTTSEANAVSFSLTSS